MNKVVDVNEDELRPLAMTKFLIRDLRDAGITQERLQALREDQLTALLDDLVAVLRKFDQLHLKAYRLVCASVPVDMSFLDQFAEACGLGPEQGHVLYLHTGEVFRALCHPLKKYGLL